MDLYKYSKMSSFFSSFTKAVKSTLSSIKSTVVSGINTIAMALYNATVSNYTDTIGRPAIKESEKTITPEIIDEIVEEDEIVEDDTEIIPLTGTPKEKITKIKKAIMDHGVKGLVSVVIIYSNTGSTFRIPFTLGTYRKQLKELRDIIEFLDDFKTSDLVGSDPMVTAIKNIDSATGFRIEDLEGEHKRLAGGFFKYTHNITDKKVIDILDKLDIHHKTHLEYNGSIYSRCLVTALRHQLPESEWLHLDSIIKSDFILKESLQKIAKKLKRSILLRHMDKDGHINKTYYNTKASHNKITDLDICLVDDHYFTFIENTGISKFFLENYNDLKDNTNPSKSKCNKIKPDGKLQIATKNFMNSIQLVKCLLDNSDILLTPLSVENLLSHPDKYLEFNRESRSCDLSVIEGINIENSCAPMGANVSSDFKNFIIFDYESFNDSNKRHLPYCISIYGLDGEIDRSFHIDIKNVNITAEIDKLTTDCFAHIAMNHPDENTWKKPYLLFAHNLTYDMGFILRHPRFTNLKPLINNGMIVSCTAIFNYGNNQKCHFLFKDSYRLMPMKLSKLPESLGITGIKKEVMFYDVYNQDTIRNIDQLSKTTIDKYLNNYKQNALDKKEADSKITEFYQNLDDYKFGKGYNLLKYALFYCEQDCKVAYQALKEFNKLFKELNPRMPNIWNFYSLPSLAMFFFDLEGCYEDCYSFNGLLGSYFQQFVIGGRCMLKDNTPIVKEGEIDDFDACSLYPSAMAAFPGFLKGIPEVWEKSTDLNSVDYYFLRVKITKVGKRRSFPCISTMQGGIRDWTNNLEGKIVCLDKVGLEDAIRYMDIEYDIIDGYYFTEKFNTKINTVIKRLYDWRLSVKHSNKALANVIKLLMNSSYGKLIQKSNDSDSKIIVGYNKLNKYTQQRHIYIKSIESIGADLMNDTTSYIVKEYKPIIESSSSPHLGCQILSYSKRIMNQVMYTAEDNGLDIYYQDTDSMHIDRSSISILSKKYKEIYGKKLIGEQLGQFHSDFEVKGLDPKTTYSCKFIGLMKKTYVDCCVDDKGNTGYHIRAKGFSLSSIEDCIQRENITPEVLYERVLHGSEYSMNLLANNGCSFEKSNGFQYTSRDEFYRLFKMQENDSEVECE